METVPASVEAFWQEYLDTLPEGADRSALTYTAWQFGDSPALADELLDLVLRGIKTATCASVQAMELDNEPIPRVGDYSVVLDGRGEPACVIQTWELTLRPFSQVDAAFAYEEGEGDRSLEYWREAHLTFFRRSSAQYGYELADDMPLACERFRLLYPLPSAPDESGSHA